MNELSLFSGGGGGLLATQHLLGFRTVCYVEINRDCQQVLQARIRDGLLDDAPIWDDVRTFDGRPWRGCVDLVTAGFPCQPFSTAGKRKGAKDKNNLWPETVRVINEVRPEWCLLENSPALRCPHGKGVQATPAYFGQILRDLAAGGFDAEWDCIPASALGAYHQRDRLWLVAHAAGNQRTPASGLSQEGKSVLGQSNAGVASDTHGVKARSVAEILQGGQPESGGKIIADADSIGHGPPKDGIRPGRKAVEHGAWWAREPRLERVVYGVADRVDERGQALGEGQVPAVVTKAWEVLS